MTYHWRSSFTLFYFLSQNTWYRFDKGLASELHSMTRNVLPHNIHLTFIFRLYPLIELLIFPYTVHYEVSHIFFHFSWYILTSWSPGTRPSIEHRIIEHSFFTRYIVKKLDIKIFTSFSFFGGNKRIYVAALYLLMWKGENHPFEDRQQHACSIWNIKWNILDLIHFKFRNTD